MNRPDTPDSSRPEGEHSPSAAVTPRPLAELLSGIAARSIDAADVPTHLLVTDITLDSRAATPGSLFLACQGRTHHGLRFAQQAVANGARAVLFETDDAGLVGGHAGSAGAHAGLVGGPVASAGTRAGSISGDVGPAGAHAPIGGPVASAGGTTASTAGASGAVNVDRAHLDVLAALDSDIFVAAVPHLSRYAGILADRFFGSPSQAMTVAGITGTNGKTTSAWLLAQALQLCGRPAAYMGTLGYGLPPSVTATEHTTSDAVSLHRQLADCRALGAECVAMEVSSHALDQDRVAGVRFHAAAFTNLTHDHLDYHRTMQAYGDAKTRLFNWPGLAHRVINVDDAFGAQLAAQLSPASLVITTRQDADRQGLTVGPWRQAKFVRARRVKLERSGLVMAIESSWGSGELAASLVGDFNVENLLTVLGVLLAWNIPFAQAVQALSQCKAASGRMEMFGGDGEAPLVIVDYAHTPDGLAKALSAARQHCRGNLRVVFGCGGDRDAGKRPVMGRIAADLADDIIITDDNPRTEDPARIVADIVAGIPSGVAKMVEHDRAAAIRMSLERSGPNDVIVIAGKGHEDYQIYGTTRRHFSDQEIVRAQIGGRAV